MNATLTIPTTTGATAQLPRTAEFDRAELQATVPLDRADAHAPEAGLAPREAAAPASAMASSAATDPARFDARHANAFAIASFVLGLVSVVAGWSFFAPITGLVLGVMALRRGTGERALALWGVWLNGILLALAVLAGLAMLAFFAFGVIAAPLFAV